MELCAPHRVAEALCFAAALRAAFGFGQFRDLLAYPALPAVEEEAPGVEKLAAAAQQEAESGGLAVAAVEASAAVAATLQIVSHESSPRCRQGQTSPAMP